MKTSQALNINKKNTVLELCTCETEAIEQSEGIELFIKVEDFIHGKRLHYKQNWLILFKTSTKK